MRLAQVAMGGEEMESGWVGVTYGGDPSWTRSNCWSISTGLDTGLKRKRPSLVGRVSWLRRGLVYLEVQVFQMFLSFQFFLM